MGHVRFGRLWLGIAVTAACSDGSGPDSADRITVSGVNPDNGGRAGGTALTITGSNFPEAIDSVRVGGGRLGDLVRVSSTELTGVTPASSTGGATDVIVYAAGSGRGRCTGCFIYDLLRDPAGTQGQLDGLLTHLQDPALLAVTTLAEPINRVLTSTPPWRGTIPPVLLGRRYELDQNSGYEIWTPSADPLSVEFVLYAIDTLTGRPALPLSPVGVYRLRGTAPLVVTLERNGEPFLTGSVVFTSNEPLSSVPDVLVQGDGVLVDGTPLGLRASEEYDYVTRASTRGLTSGEPPAQVVIGTEDRHGPAFDSRYELVAAGADSIAFGTSSVDFGVHQSINGVALNSVTLTDAAKRVLLTADVTLVRGTRLAFSFAATVLSRGQAYPGSPALWVERVSPDRGPVTGGTAMTITGRNFPEIVDSVRLGADRLLNLVRVGETQLTGTTPAGSTAATVDVTVFAATAGSATCAGCFAFELPPAAGSRDR